METADSEQTSSAIMLWVKTRVYVCSGRAGGNERHLLFYARYEEPLRYSTILYFTLLYSTLLYSTLFYSTLFYFTLIYSILLYFTLLTLLYLTLLCDLVRNTGSFSGKLPLLRTEVTGWSGL